MKIIQNGSLVTPIGLRRADLAMDSDKIVRIDTHIDPTDSDEVFDATGCWVFPGFIDAHTHMQAWTGIDWTADSFETGTRAAVCGGTTTIVDYATADRGVSLPAALEEWHKRADGTCAANYGFHMAIAEWNDQNKQDMKRMRDEGISSFKTYLAYKHLCLHDDEQLQVLEQVRDLDSLLCCHCETGALIDMYQERVVAAGITGPEGHPISRPPEAEADAVSRLLYLSDLAQANVNVVHLSSRLGLLAIRAAKARGHEHVFVESCPQYLLLDDTCYSKPNFEGAKYVMSPPLRKRSDVHALREAVIEGEIDTLATDHCSFNLYGQKDRGKDCFVNIPNGGPGVEHRPALIATSFAGELGPTDLARLMCENPARVFGMYPEKGILQEGSDADICVWNPETTWTISAQNQHQALDHTTYEGFECKGQAQLVFVNGELVARDGEPTDAKPGAYVKRHAPVRPRHIR